MDIAQFKKTYEHKKVEEKKNKVAENPLVTVCIQTYQHVDYIKECLDSILNQETNFDYEILLGEDASSDGTREICKEYAAKYSDKIRLFLHHRENNIKIGGQPTGRFNFLYNLYSARGKYIALCEGDDYWTDPLKLQKQVDFLEENKDYALHCTNALILDGKKQIPSQNDSVSFNAFDVLNKNFTFTASLCFRKDDILIPDFMYISPAGDWLLILYALRKKKGYFSNEITCAYRIHEGGVWSQLEIENEKAIKKRFENLKANATIYQYISKDTKFNIRVRKLAAQKQESYAYQAKRMAILYPFLSFNTNDLEPKSLASFAKLKFTQLKTVFN